MACITVPLEKSFKDRIASFPWVNWSELAREETLKKEIFNEYINTGRLSDKDWEFCDSIDWHPVDWLPLRKEYVKKLEKARKEPGTKFGSVDEFFENIQ